MKNAILEMSEEVSPLYLQEDSEDTSTVDNVDAEQDSEEDEEDEEWDDDEDEFEDEDDDEEDLD